MKHIDLRYHFIREAVEDGKICVKYIPTDENVSDTFTKALPRLKFQKMVEILGPGDGVDVARDSLRVEPAMVNAKSKPGGRREV